MERCGVIDLGSNSVRLVVYDVEEAPGKGAGASKGPKRPRFSTLVDNKKMLGLSAYVSEGVLSEEGIERAAEALAKHLRRARVVDCAQVQIFATAVLRNCKNSKTALQQLEEAIDHPICLLSGEQEAHLDFVGALWGRDVAAGTLVDIGGGSTELVAIRKNQDVKLVSLDVGSVSTYRRFVQLVLPSPQEYAQITQDFAERFAKRCDAEAFAADTLYGVGGSARALAKLKAVRQGSLKIPKRLERADLETMYELLKDDPSAFAHSAARAVPDRLHTIGCGLAILRFLMEQLGAQTLEICRYGVREGFLIERMLSGTPGT